MRFPFAGVIAPFPYGLRRVGLGWAVFEVDWPVSGLYS